MSMDRDGFKIVPNVLTAAECDAILQSFESDESTQNAHSSVMWNLRCHPKVQDVFCKIWNCTSDDLLSSFDGAGYRYLGQEDDGIGWHVDQNSTHDLGMVNVQGVLSINGMNARTGGTVLLAGSHTDHEQVCARNCDEEEEDSSWEFVPISDEDEIFDKCSIVQPVVHKGEMLVWDSRLVHRCMPPADADHTARVVVYMSMVPRSHASDSILRMRRWGYSQGVATTHWCSRFVDRGVERHRPKWPYRRSSPQIRALVG